MNARHPHIHNISASWRWVTSALVAAISTAVFLVAPVAHAEAACPNEAIREAQKSTSLPDGSTSLPDCMALEMVTPPKKFNQQSESAKFSPDGEHMRFTSGAALGETTSMPTFFNFYVASRGPAGWSTQSVQPPADIAAGFDISGRPCGYDSDLSHWVTWGASGVQAQLAISTAFRGTLGAPFTPLGPTLAPFSGGQGGTGGEGTVRNGYCEGASADAEHIFFSLRDVSYFPDDPKVETFAEGSGTVADDGTPLYFANAYEAYLDEGTPSLRLLQRDRDGVVYGGRCGARIGDLAGGVNLPRFRGAISIDASRVYFLARPSQPEGVPCNEAANPIRIMERLETPTGPVISQLVTSECTRVSPPCSSVDGNDVFLGASQEGTKVYFTTVRQLTNSDEDTTADLYFYDTEAPSGERLTQVSAGEPGAPTPGAGAEVLGLPDFAGNGSRAYFVAKGVLTTVANQAGESPQTGQPNLYLYDAETGHTAFVSTLSAGDGETWATTAGEGNEAMAVPRLGPDVEDQAVGGDGHILVFSTHAALSSGDTDGGKADLYRYDAESSSLQWVSTAAPGGSDNGAFSVSGTSRRSNPGAQSVSFGAWVSEDGEKIVFETAEALDPTDTNGKANAYLWHEGGLTAIPFGIEPTIGMSGNEVAFTSPERLLPQDGDATTDVYVARVDGGYPIIVPPPPCVEEGCQGAPSARPGEQGAASDALRPGNPQPSKPCRKGFVKKRGSCTRKPAHKAKRHQHQRQASHKQGGHK